MAAGLLLLFRRTTLLGALLAAGVMANVVVVNYAYAIGVFFASLQLLAAAAVLVTMDGSRLWAFARGQAVPILPTAPSSRRLRWSAGLIVALAALGSASNGWTAWRSQITRQAAPLAGVYEPESLTINGQDRPLLLTDGACWRRVWIADLAPVLYVYAMDGTAHGFRMKLDEAAGLMTLEDPSIQGPSELHFSVPDNGHLVLEGQLGAQRISARLRKLDTATLPLQSEPFHWVSD